MLNIWLDEERALVAVDTQLVDMATKAPYRNADGSLAEISKMFPLVAANVILAGRGQSAFLATLASGLLLTASTFEALDEFMPKAIEGASAQFKRMQALAVEAEGVASVLGLQQFVLVGWSPKRGRMFGVSYRIHGSSVTRTEIGGETGDDLVAPWERQWGQPPEHDSEDGMRELAARQLECTSQLEEHPSVGGRMLLAELRNGSLTINGVGISA